MAPALLALAAAAFPAAQDAAPDLSDPIALFKGVCLADSVALPKGSVAAQPYAGLPDGAKAALSFANPPRGVPSLKPPEAAAGLPNRILAVLPGKTSYLLLPADTGPYAGSCAIVWRGNHFSDALKAAQALAPDAVVPTGSTPIVGLNYTVIQSKGMIVGAAELQGWTVLRIAPDTSPQEPSTQ